MLVPLTMLCVFLLGVMVSGLRSLFTVYTDLYNLSPVQLTG